MTCKHCGRPIFRVPTTSWYKHLHNDFDKCGVGPERRNAEPAEGR